MSLVSLEADVAVDRLHRHHDVDAVGPAVDVLVDPVQLELELLGRERERAEHAHAAGVGDRGDHVAAVARRRRSGTRSRTSRSARGSSCAGPFLGAGCCSAIALARGSRACRSGAAASRRRGGARAAPCSRRSWCGSARPARRASGPRPGGAARRRRPAGPSARRPRPTTSASNTFGWRLQRRLDLLGVDLLAARVDALRAAAEQRHRAVELEAGEVAGHRVALAVDLDEGRGRLLRVLVVPERDVAAPGHAADLAGLHRLVVARRARSCPGPMRDVDEPAVADRRCPSRRGACR